MWISLVLSTDSMTCWLLKLLYNWCSGLGAKLHKFTAVENKYSCPHLMLWISSELSTCVGQTIFFLFGSARFLGRFPSSGFAACRTFRVGFSRCSVFVFQKRGLMVYLNR